MAIAKVVPFSADLKLIQSLDKYFEADWNLMGLFILGRTLELSRPTIAVWVKFSSAAD